jgi:LPXTG-motif cell wall-anchored protein
MMAMPGTLMAATTPGLGQADSFFILSSTYTNTVGGTTITGDLGYTTGPAVAPTVNGTTFGSSSKYNQAGIDQGSALSALNSQPADHSYATGAVDLSSNTNFFDNSAIGHFSPGVYVIDGAASIGTGGITLEGSGTYIFRINGALTTVVGSIITLANGASPCDVFWTPSAATTLGANSTFVGTDIDPSGITIGSTVNWTGRALAFGGTVSTDTDTLTITPCGTPTALTASQGILTIYKVDGNGNPIVATTSAMSAAFNIYANAGDVGVNSPIEAGSTIQDTNFFSVSLPNGTYYVVEKTAPAGYSADSTVRSVTISGGDATLTFVNVSGGENSSGTATTTTVGGTATTTASTTVTSTVSGGQLPKTSTPWYNILLIGIALILTGAVTWVVVKKKRTE